MSAIWRLHCLLESVHQHGINLGGSSPIWMVLRNVIDEPEVDIRHLFEIYSDMIKTTDRALEEVTAFYTPLMVDRHDGDKKIDTLTKDIVSIQKSLLSNSIQSPVSVLLQHDPGKFETLAITVSSFGQQKDPTGEDVAKARKQLLEALEIIIRADVSPEFKDSFSRAIHRILRALDHYDIFGPEAVVDAIGRLTGEVAMQPESYKEPSKSVISETLAQVANIMTIIRVNLEFGSALVSFVQRYLPAVSS